MSSRTATILYKRFYLCLMRTIPNGNPVSPPELAGNAPGLNVFHPVVIGLFPILRDEFGLALFHCGDGRLGHRLGVDIPLIRHPRLDDDV